MRRVDGSSVSSLGVAVVAVVAAVGVGAGGAGAQVVEIEEFAGELFEGFEGAMCCIETQPCVEPEVFGGVATLCSGIAHVAGNWGYLCVMRPHEGIRQFGSMEGAATFRFTQPVRRFGAMIGSNALERGEPSDRGRAEFYDAAGGLVGTGTLELDDHCAWRWHGWESAVPVARIVIRGSSITGGEAFVMMDSVRIDLWDGVGCYADCDGSGELDFFDFLCFQNAFASGSGQADCDLSGAFDFFDFLCFQDAFSAGCG
jgi:hypothetical protein